jgi:hypothetical protein
VRYHTPQGNAQVSRKSKPHSWNRFGATVFPLRNEPGKTPHCGVELVNEN